ncbi:hypothetical protein R70723_13065 [Paenibacillus sp. FSL R7-0273]|uniref:hypothetical protein n=1 Tax=Paenibacillus sp. FSL R7-0273 TaxID=1536772 RepID=UPI0004F79C01|nr:hypothetical protein [Paenibacillus sp. FSL R7-0273]AIQ46695.1 hypothetical protein R70723_13065 [Paenibacillus sp. FSL R7-0273]
MNKYKAHISDFDQVKRNFGYLTSFQLTRASELDDFRTTLQITLAQSTFDYEEQLLITFTGVSELETGQLAGLVCWLYFDITDISKDQLENLRFKVVEYENNIFRLYCRQITFEIIKG